MKSCTFGRTPSSVEGGKGVVKREEEDQAFLSSRRQESKRERERGSGKLPRFRCLLWQLDLNFCL